MLTVLLATPSAIAATTFVDEAADTSASENDSPCFWWYRPDLEVTACFNRMPPGPFCLRVDGVVDDCWDPLGP